MMIPIGTLKIEQFVHKKSIHRNGNNPITNANPLIRSDGFQRLIYVKFEYEQDSGEDEKVFLHDDNFIKKAQNFYLCFF